MRTTPSTSPRRPHTDPLTFEPIEPRLLLDSAPIGITTADDRTAVIAVRDASLDLFTQDSLDGRWTRQGFGDLIPEDFIPTSAATFTDPATGRIFHALSAPRGLAVLPDPDDNSNVGPDDVLILTEEIAGAQPIASNITTFTSVEGENGEDGRVHIAGLTADGDLVLYAQTGERTDANRARWAFTNLSDDVLAPQGIDTPFFQGGLASFATPWNSLNIVGLDAGGDIQNVWFAPPSPAAPAGSWNLTNLSDIAGTPTLAGGNATGLTAYLTPWNGINIAGIDPTGDLIVTWWVPEFGSAWQATNLTDAFGGPALTPGTVLAYTTPWGGLNVGGITAAGAGGAGTEAGNLALWWWVPEFGDQWRIAEDVVPDAEPLAANVVGTNAGAISSFTSPGGAVNILGLAAADGDVIRLSWRPDDIWRAENLDALATGDPGAPGPIDPDLEPLADTWRITGSGGIFDEFDIDETATVTLRPDGVWTLDDGDFDLSIFDSGADRGTWDFANGTFTIVIPDTGSATATGVPPDAATFTTRGINLTASGRSRLDNRIDDLDDDIPFFDLRDEIDDRGGLDAILADIDLRWTRL